MMRIGMINNQLILSPQQLFVLAHTGMFDVIIKFWLLLFDSSFWKIIFLSLVSFLELLLNFWKSSDSVSQYKKKVEYQISLNIHFYVHLRSIFISSITSMLLMYSTFQRLWWIFRSSICIKLYSTMYIKLYYFSKS